MTEQELNKACEWLEDCLPDIEYITNASALRQDKKKFIEAFRKAMGAVIKDSLTTKLTWHKASEELPEMAHFTADGDYSDLCVCINESGEHKILVLCEQGDCTYWAYGYDGEDLYDEELEGEIVKWMKIPKED